VQADVDLTTQAASLRRDQLVANTVYECGERYLGERRCPGCGCFCRLVGLDGYCPECDGLPTGIGAKRRGRPVPLPHPRSSNTAIQPGLAHGIRALRGWQFAAYAALGAGPPFVTGPLRSVRVAIDARPDAAPTHVEHEQDLSLSTLSVRERVGRAARTHCGFSRSERAAEPAWRQARRLGAYKWASGLVGDPDGSDDGRRSRCGYDADRRWNCQTARE
jgi:hypothetical protein